jgi:hypothetical protein
MALSVSGMEYERRGLALCQKLPWCHVNVRNVSLCEGIDKGHHTLSNKKGKSKWGVCMQDMGYNEQMYERAGGFWNGWKLLSDVLSQTAHHRAHDNGKEKNVQSIKNGMSHL